MLYVTALKVAFKTTVTGARENHICAERRRIGVFTCRQVTVTGVGVAFRAVWKNGKKKQQKVQFSRLKFLVCCVFYTINGFKSYFHGRSYRKNKKWTLQASQLYFVAGLLYWVWFRLCWPSVCLYSGGLQVNYFQYISTQCRKQHI